MALFFVYYLLIISSDELIFSAYRTRIMNLVLLFSSIWFTLFGLYTCAVLPKTSPTTPSSSSPFNLIDSVSDVGQEQGRSLPLISEKKLNESLDDQAGDHDQGQKTSVVARKGVFLTDDDEKGKVATTEVHTNRNISIDRASTTVTKDNDSLTNRTSEMSSSVKGKDSLTTSDKTSSYASDKYSPYESKSTKTGTSSSSSSSSIVSSKQDNTSTSSVTSKSSVSTESTSSKSSSFNKKPLITYSVEEYPAFLIVPRVRQLITPLTPLDVKAEADESAYLPPSSDFVLDRMQSKRELYIFPLVVLIFLVPMVLGVGIIILRRVRDYWSTRHYRRMDFLVDGMYNT